MATHEKNLEIVLRHSNATPIRGHTDIGYLCFFCRAGFADPNNLKSHTLECHKDFILEERSLRPRRQINVDHYSLKIDVTNLTCLCLKRFDHLNDLMHHLSADHDQPIKIEDKNYFLSIRFDGDKPKCALCDAEFIFFRNLVEHMSSHYGNYICDVCSAGFVTKANLRTHKTTHMTGDYPCKQCHMVYSTRVKLNNHIRFVHRGQVNRYTCSYCDERFSSLVVKNKHQVQAHGVAPTVAKCSACDKTFASYNTLGKHYRKHHLMIMNFKCSFCEKEFAQNCDLQDHIVKHTGARDFKCDVCQKAYGRRDTLRQHMKIHNNDRRYKCEHCPAAFIQRNSLKYHLRSKHGIDGESSLESTHST